MRGVAALAGQADVLEVAGVGAVTRADGARRTQREVLTDKAFRRRMVMQTL